MTAYLQLAGKKRGAIAGGLVQKGHEKQIGVLAVEHGMARAPDTGALAHEPLLLTKRVDRSSPLLAAMLDENEPMTLFELQFWAAAPRGTATGIETHIYTIRLTDAVIAGITLDLADQLDPDLAARPLTETLSFTYTAIEWTWVDGGITTSATP